jgi:hypothetical protein
MENELKILGFAGSLRKGSYNKSLLRSASQLLPHETSLEIFDLSDIPPYNQDLDNNIPPKVKEFKTSLIQRGTPSNNDLDPLTWDPISVTENIFRTALSKVIVL